MVALATAERLPTAEEILQRRRRPSLPAGVRYALLLGEPRRANAKPLACPDLAELARTLHRRRRGAGLQLCDAELLVYQDDTPRRGVSLWAIDASTGDACRYLGFAYLAGAGRLALEAALRAEQPAG